MGRTHFITRVLAAPLAALLLAACTVHKQDTPGLTGPSEFSTAIGVAISPDVLTQDGASQAVVTVTARDSNGQALRNLSLRAEIVVEGASTDFGSLSARNVVTDANGRATLTYTAPRHRCSIRTSARKYKSGSHPSVPTPEVHSRALHRCALCRQASSVRRPARCGPTSRRPAPQLAMP